MTKKIEIDHQLSIGHGGDSEKARLIGAKWAETFEIFGDLRSHHSIMDIGCSPGRMAIAIGERFGWSNNYLGKELIMNKNQVNSVFDNLHEKVNLAIKKALEKDQKLGESVVVYQNGEIKTFTG